MKFTAVIPAERQRVRAKRGPMVNSAASAGIQMHARSVALDSGFANFVRAPE
jgi:hypothetical protein